MFSFAILYDFRVRHELFLGELYQAKYQGELYLIDHRKSDVLVVQEANSRNEALRPWITAVFDQYSRALVGYYLGFEPPSSRRVALALRHAILPKNDPDWPMCGIPTKVRHDYGQDLVSKHIQQVKIDLHISDFPKEKANPRGNAEMERFYGTMAEWERGLPGWIGNSVKERPEKVKPTLTLPEFDKRFRAFVHNYHHQKHSTTKMTPFDRWNTGLIPKLPETEECLDLLLLPIARPYKIRRDGIHFRTNRYWSDDLLLYIGETAVLRYDPLRLDEIVVYVGNKRVGNAILQSENHQTFESHRKRRAKQAELMRNYKKESRPDESSETTQNIEPEDTNSKTSLKILGASQQELSKSQVPKKDTNLIIFPVNKEGEDWW